MSSIIAVSESSAPPYESHSLDASRSRITSHTKYTAVPQPPSEGATVNPDDLFKRCTIPEVKHIQQKLKRDADAKQEELRLMVGERYRDLLQSSTSIISISQSSQRVLTALDDIQQTILSQHESPLPKQTTKTSGVGDRRLLMLQSLSGHIKLLLDAPEFLWRFLEKKKYFQTAWLLLLAQVVHRALVHHDDSDEESWSSQGIDVLTEFPLVRRQWDVVSQFRAQIIHKATLSLCEATASSEETCATLLTLHVLDSRPLGEAFSTLLLQRSNSLQSVLSWKVPIQANATGDPDTSAKTSQRVLLRDLKAISLKAFHLVSHTLRTCRDIFDTYSTGPSLMNRVLISLQSESPDILTGKAALPKELIFTTQDLLTGLISSTHFALLPPNIKTFKPYVDMSSSSSVVLPGHLTHQLFEWFSNAMQHLRNTMTIWFALLQSAKDIWNFRTGVQDWMLHSGLREQEKMLVDELLDDLCRSRIVGIWKAALVNAKLAFRSLLEQAMLTEGRRKGSSASDFLFELPPLPSPLGVENISFTKYQRTLKRQLMGRNTVLDSVLQTLEDCARQIQQDVLYVSSNSSESNDDDRAILSKLTLLYEPIADSFASEVVEVLRSVSESQSEDPESSINGLVFLGRIANELAFSSFILRIGCRRTSVQDFHTQILALYASLIDRWRCYSVANIISQYKPRYSNDAALILATPTEPSPTLVQGLLSLSVALRQLGLPRDLGNWQGIVHSTLQAFISAWTDEVKEIRIQQAMFDLAFLWLLVRMRKIDTQPKFPLEINEAYLEDHQASLSQYLARTQTLFSAFLPLPGVDNSPHATTVDNLTTLLPYGIPTTSQQQFPTSTDTTKPNPRFVLLLVENHGETR